MTAIWCISEEKRIWRIHTQKKKKRKRKRRKNIVHVLLNLEKNKWGYSWMGDSE